MGIYLLGYVVEMMLKNACFLTDGARPADPVAPRLGPIRSWARQHLPTVPHEGYHSLWFWVQVLRKKRVWHGRSWTGTTDARLLQRVHRLYGIWVVTIRYRPDQALPQEAENVYHDVTWIRDRGSQLVY